MNIARGAVHMTDIQDAPHTGASLDTLFDCRIIGMVATGYIPEMETVYWICVSGLKLELL